MMPVLLLTMKAEFMIFQRLAILGLVLAMMLPHSADALSSLKKPSGSIILSVTGNIERTNAEGRADLDWALLESIGMVEIKTKTPFTDKPKVFRGVLARDLLQYLGASGTQIEAAAINLYKVEVPIEDFERFDVLFAVEVDGKRLRIRDQGPSWIVYPWSHHEELDREIYSRRSVWQMNAIDVR